MDAGRAGERGFQGLENVIESRQAERWKSFGGAFEVAGVLEVVKRRRRAYRRSLAVGWRPSTELSAAWLKG